MDSTSSGTSDNTQKALITVGVLGGAIIVALIVAKIVDYCYDRHIATSDNASDISEQTRDLIRMRLAVKAFRKKKPGDKAPGEISAKQRKIIRLWSAKAKESRRIAEQRRAEENAKHLAVRNDLIIKVEEASGDAKLQPGLTGAVASLTVVSEKSTKAAKTGAAVSEKAAKKPAEKDNGPSPKTTFRFAIRPELKRTLTGLDTSNTTPLEAPAVASVSNFGNKSVLQGKQNAADFSTEVQVIRTDQDTPHTSRSEADPEVAALTDRTDGSQSPDPKSPNPKAPVSKSPASKSPDRADGSKSPGPKSPNPKAPVSKSTASRSPDRTDGSKSPGPKSPGRKAPVSKSPTLISPESNSHTSPGSDSPESKPSKSLPPKSPGSKSVEPKSPDEESPRPTLPVKSESQKGVVTPENDSKAVNEEMISKAGENSSEVRDSSAPDTTYTQVESIGEGPSAKDVQPESQDSSVDCNKSSPTPSTPRKLFTVVRATENPSPAKTKNSSPSKDSSKGATPSPSKPNPKSKPRPKSFNAKEDSKFNHLPPRMANSVALYGRTSGDLQVHKNTVTKKKAAVSPSRTTGSSAAASSSGSKPVQNTAVAARKSRAKSARS